MSEPTIDEMLAWVDEAAVTAGPRDDKYRNAIRAILEQQRDTVYLAGNHDLRVVRAFVGRVLRRTTDSGGAWNAMQDELVAMEKEAE